MDSGHCVVGSWLGRQLSRNYPRLIEKDSLRTTRLLGAVSLCVIIASVVCDVSIFVPLYILERSLL